MAEIDGISDPGPSGKVWVSVLTNIDYLPGFLVLHHSLKQNKTKYPLVALYTDSFPAEGHEALKRRGIPERRIDYIRPSLEKDYGNDPRFQETWTKLTIFSLVEFERVVLLDSDMLVLKNLDELMDVELDPPSMNGDGDRVYAASHACVCNPMKKPHYPKDWVPAKCAFRAQHSIPDLAQTQGYSNLSSFGMPNSGTVVTNPSQAVFAKVLDKLKDDEAIQSYIFPDQALLGDLFYGRWVTLPYVYNALKTLRAEGVHSDIWRDDRVKVLHYIFSPKPWNGNSKNIGDDLHGWWHRANATRKEDELKSGVNDAY